MFFVCLFDFFFVVFFFCFKMFQVSQNVRKKCYVSISYIVLLFVSALVSLTYYNWDYIKFEKKNNPKNRTYFKRFQSNVRFSYVWSSHCKNSLKGKEKLEENSQENNEKKWVLCTSLMNLWNSSYNCLKLL